MFQLIATPTYKGICNRCQVVFAKGAPRSASKLSIDPITEIVTPHILEKVQGQIKEMCQLIEPCLLIGTREY